VGTTEAGGVTVIDTLAELVAERIVSRGPDVPRLALTRQEAAQSLGISIDHYERHVLPELRVVRSGRLVLVPVDELRRWVDDHAALTLHKLERAA
jgi:hypothetical protein